MTETLVSTKPFCDGFTKEGKEIFLFHFQEALLKEMEEFIKDPEEKEASMTD